MLSHGDIAQAQGGFQRIEIDQAHPKSKQIVKNSG